VKTPVVVTGGASGIGLAAVERLLDDGWPVAVIDQDEEALSDAHEELSGEDVMFLSADVTDEDIVAEAFDRVVDAMGPVGGLVNSAGIARDIPVMETSPELFRQVLDVNVVGSFICAKAAIERMADTLSIVNIGSVAGLLGSKGRVAYGASKAAVKLMTEVMANELGAREIRVNCVAPGPVNTPLIARLHTPEDRKLWTDRVPQRRYCEPVEIAAAISFLISPEASFVNGHTLTVDGGFSVAGIMGA
jgi:NAD(P)-dependent dehydrogenase (short-subunit alcohol dehydrogenase family)